MAKKLLYLFAFMMFGCSSVKVIYMQNDDSLMIRQNTKGELWISSMHSAQQIKIISQEQVEDTLFVSYRRGVFLSPNNVLALTDKTKYLKCANRVYEVIKTKEGFEIIDKKKQP
jgi:hypothetical protein